MRHGSFTHGVPNDPAATAAYRNLVGANPQIVLTYRTWGQPLLYPNEVTLPFPATQMLTWEPHGTSLADIGAGRYDAHIRAQAMSIKAAKRRIIIRFAHEMNGDWFSWGQRPSDYAPAWRQIVRIFRAEGATNARFIWCPNEDRDHTIPFEPYFPGKSYVTHLGFDAYDAEAEAFPAVLYHDSLLRLTRLVSPKDVPIIVCETSTSRRGADKAAWIAELSSVIGVKGVVWFNEGIWVINTDPESLAAYRKLVAR